MEIVAGAFVAAAATSILVAYVNRKQNEKANEYIKLQRAKEKDVVYNGE